MVHSLASSRRPFSLLAGFALFGSLLSACVSTAIKPLESSVASGWQGKSVAVSSRPACDFVAMTAGKAAFAMLGAVAMIEAGKSVVAENKIPEPAPLLAQDLLQTAQKHLGVVPASMAPVAVDSKDPVVLAKAAAGADLLFDVQCVGRDFRYLPVDWSHYVVDTTMVLRVVDVKKSVVVAEGGCSGNTQKDATHPTRDELLADGAALLKKTLETQRTQCQSELATKVLGIASP